MKLPILLLGIIFLILGIENNNLAGTNNKLNKKKRESYEACLRLKIKAPNLNLNCDNLLDHSNSYQENDKKDEIDNTEIKTLIIGDTRKVNKSEEIKLRNLIKKLTDGNKLRKD